MGTPRVREGRRFVFWREPLLLFAVVGSIVYGAWALLAPPPVQTVRIEQTALRALERQQEDLLGRPLTGEERGRIREAYIDDEVLLREALRRGLQWSDGRVRQRLTRIMRGALTENVADPSVAELQAYFRDNVAKYSSSESTTFVQVFFPWGEDVTAQEFEAALDAVRSGADPERFGSTSMMTGRHMPRQSRSDLVRAFGADFADFVEESPAGEWRGPIDSVLGVHLVQVLERHPPEPATFEAVEPYLRQEWLVTKTRERQQKGIDEIRARYRIEMVEE